MVVLIITNRGDWFHVNNITPKWFSYLKRKIEVLRGLDEKPAN